MRHYFIIDLLDHIMPPMKVWSPHFDSSASASAWKQKAADATGVVEIDGKWYVVKDWD
jgi:hypothetical protein